MGFVSPFSSLFFFFLLRKTVRLELTAAVPSPMTYHIGGQSGPDLTGVKMAATVTCATAPWLPGRPDRCGGAYLERPSLRFPGLCSCFRKRAERASWRLRGGGGGDFN